MSRLKLYSSKLFALEDFEDSDVAILPDEQQAKNMAEVQENLNMIETASDTMNTVIEDSHLTENIAEIVEDAAEAGEGVSETAVTLIQEAVESIYRRHGMPKRYYPKIPSLEAYGGNRIKTAKAIRHQLKVSIEDGFIDTIKSIWEKICNFFSELWDKLTGSSSSDADKANELQKRIKKVMDEKKPVPPEYIKGNVDKDEWFKKIGTWLEETSDTAKDFDAWIKEVVDNFKEVIKNKDTIEQDLENQIGELKKKFEDIDDKFAKVIVEKFKQLAAEGNGPDINDILDSNGNLDKGKFKEFINDSQKQFFLIPVGDELEEDEQSDVNKSGVSTFPNKTEWQDLHDLAGKINMSAKECKDTSGLVKKAFEDKELETYINEVLDNAKGRDDRETKNLKSNITMNINRIKEKSQLSANIIASKASLHKKILDVMEKVVKKAEETPKK